MLKKNTGALQVAVLGAIVTLGYLGIASADPGPRSFVASPDIYKVIAENEKYLIIEVTWKPGQRDVFHSHPAAGVYRLTDCELRNYSAPDKFQAGSPKKGSAVVNAAVDSHAIENVGKNECKIIMFEPK